MRKYRTGITEKRLNDRRFQKTEDAILAVFFAMRGYVSMSRLAVKVGVARSTIYCHHASIDGILTDYEKYILRKYRRAVRKMMKRDTVQTRVVYRQMALFMLQNRKIFEILIMGGNKAVLTEMVREVIGATPARMKLPKNHKIGTEIYVSSVVEILWKWGKEGLMSRELTKVLTNILYVTDNAKGWVEPLID